MKVKFDKIYLSWMPTYRDARIYVGELKEEEGVVNFYYNKSNCKKAERLGFQGYPGLKIEKEFHEDVLSIFSKRLINTQRTDFQYLLNFWKVDPEYKDDKLYLLAMTQGINGNDNFEFIANFIPEDGSEFITDLINFDPLDLTTSKLEKIKF